MTTKLETLAAEKTALEEEHGGEEAVFGELEKVNQKAVKDLVKELEARCNRDRRVGNCRAVARADGDEAAAKKALKAAEAALDEATYAHYPLLEEAEVMDIVVSDKWLVDLQVRLAGEAERVTQTLTQRVKQLAERYAEPMPQLAEEVSALEQKVQGHLEKMGFSWT